MLNPKSNFAFTFHYTFAVNRRKPSKPVKAEPEVDTAAEESEQQQKEEEPKLKRPLSSRLALRKRN